MTAQPPLHLGGGVLGLDLLFHGLGALTAQVHRHVTRPAGTSMSCSVCVT